MRKNILWLAAVAALALGALFVWKKQSATSQGAATRQTFAVPDTAAINRVIITRRLSGKRHTLERRPGNVWMLDSTEEVAPALAEQVLLTLHDLKVKRPVTRLERENVVKKMAVDNLKIEVFVAGEPAGTFFLGDMTDEAQGNYALQENSEEPVVVNLLNFQGYVSPRFEVDGPNWRNKHLFRSTPRTLQKVIVHYPEEPAQDVEVTFTKGTHYDLAGVERLDTARMSRFLAAFSQIYVEQYVDDARLRDSLEKTPAFAVVTVRDLDAKRSHELRLFAPKEDRLRYLQKSDRIYGLIADKRQAITLQPQNFQPLLLPKSYFEKPKA